MNDLLNLSKKIDDLQNELDEVKAQMNKLLKTAGVVDVRGTLAVTYVWLGGMA